MRLIYIHGLDSDANSTKGRLLDEYCQQYHPEFEVLRPDLNQHPIQVFNKLIDMVDTPKQTILVGSSLGGYFATLVSHKTQCGAFLLNPSIQPHSSLQRFFSMDTAEADNTIGHTTEGGWEISKADLQWFAKHQLQDLPLPKNFTVLAKLGDELLDAQKTADFYQAKGAKVILQAGGDHRMSDFAKQLPMVMQEIQSLLA
ncbi:YqiA/YcfP family alpha/beta fold hydrolase [Psychrobacter sp. I-STPA10]|uniref:YqiA/YcfP family alpha/beta fold hydrolase n=1 Tax=Psychrobacter sp. I-STPA10 TaxID=2585769 RepID=UPI001E34FF57|nr:YqiA/YcfP family alpha/beta fold hydrolase [Psychrobacter sp. I-STPA10]